MQEDAVAYGASLVGDKGKHHADQRTADNQKRHAFRSERIHGRNMGQAEKDGRRQNGDPSVPSVFQQLHEKAAKQRFLQNAGFYSCRHRSDCD